MLWGLVFSRVVGSEDTVAALLRQNDVDGDHDWTKIMKSNGEDPEALREIWRKSKACEVVQQLLPNKQDRADGELTDNPRKPDRSGIPLTWMNPSVPGKMSAAEGESAISSAEEHEDTASNVIDLRLRDDENIRPQASTPKLSQAATHEFELPPNYWHLLDIYFNFTHCWFPILEKHDVLRAAYASPRKAFSAADLTSKSGEHAALWAALTYASAHQTAIGKKISNTGSDSSSFTSEKLYTRARGLIPSEDSEFGWGHVQALLILGLYKLGYGSKNTAWLLVSHAVRFALALGMDESDVFGIGETQGQSFMPNRSHHIFLGCFVLETLISSLVGRAPYLTSEAISRSGLLREDGLEEWEPWANTIDLHGYHQTRRTASSRKPAHILGIFNQLTKLSSIFNGFLHDSLSAAFDAQFPEKYQRMFDEWHTQLPEYCRFSKSGEQSFSISSSLLPHIWNLQLIYTTMMELLNLRRSNLQRRFVTHTWMTEVSKKATPSTNTIMQLLKQYNTVFPSVVPSSCVYSLYLAQIIDTPGTSDSRPELQTGYQTILPEISMVWPQVQEIYDEMLSPHSGGKRRKAFHNIVDPSYAMNINTFPDREPSIPQNFEASANLSASNVIALPDEQDSAIRIGGTVGIDNLTQDSGVGEGVRTGSQKVSNHTNEISEARMSRTPHQSCNPIIREPAPASGPVNVVTSPSTSVGLSTAPESSIFDQLASLDSAEW